uniref:Uncharacterized protein n=1 Tax=Populus trichocarpa TaxID=3694 RepID=A0A2K1Y4Y7_POPTR
MQVVPREGESALSVSGPRPMEWSTVLYAGPQGPGKNGKQHKSSLESPIMLLTDGNVIASGSHDKEIFLWYIHGECKNFMVMRGHKNAVLDLHWTTDGSQIISASPDKIVRVGCRGWKTDKEIGRTLLFCEFMLCCLSAGGLHLFGSDYGTAKLWEMRPKGAIQTFPDKYQITAASFSDISDKIFTGVIDNDIKVRDIRKGEVTMTLEGHQDMITGMQLSPDGSYLLMNGMDNKLCIWDMRPFAPQNRCVKIFEGHQHNNFEKNFWSPDGSMVTAVQIAWLIYESVNECVFHPTEPIFGSCSSDKQIYLGEI